MILNFILYVALLFTTLSILYCLRVDMVNDNQIMTVDLKISDGIYNDSFSIYMNGSGCYTLNNINLSSILNPNVSNSFSSSFSADNCTNLILNNYGIIGEEYQLNFTVLLNPASLYTLYIITNGTIIKQKDFTTLDGKSGPVMNISYTTPFGIANLRLQWSPPSNPKGQIHAYVASINKTGGTCVLQWWLNCVDCSTMALGSQNLQLFSQSCVNFFNASFKNSDKTFHLESNDSRITPFTPYSLQIMAINGYGGGDVAFLNFTTDQYTLSVVRNFTCTKVTSNQFMCSWQEPSRLNGPSITYNLNCQNDTIIANLTLGYGSLSTTIQNNVFPDINYTCSICACTSVGCSNMTSTNIMIAPSGGPSIGDSVYMKEVMNTSGTSSTSSQIPIMLPYSLFNDNLGCINNFTLIVVVNNKGSISNSSNNPGEKTHSECDQGYACPYVINLIFPQSIARKKRSTLGSGRNWQNLPFIVGENTTCTNGPCNGPLRASTEYLIGFRVCLSSGCIVIAIVKSTIVDIVSNSIDIAIPIVVFFVILAAGCILLVFYLRHRRNKNSENNSLISKEDPDSSYVNDFPQYYMSLMKDSCGKASIQFSDLDVKCKELENGKKLNFVMINEIKNRYRNIRPYEHNLVKLTNPEDYINASRICSDHFSINIYGQCACSNFYIATQGPLGENNEYKPSTMGDFWRMAFQYNVRIIINLTKCVESFKEKCAQYWPESVNERMTFKSGGHILEVKLKSMITNSIFEERLFAVKMDGQEQLITQLHIMVWPDHDCPDVEDFIEFYDRFNTIKNDKYPIIVHCSAGVGRTGTFILIDIELRKLISQSDKIEIFKTLFNLRQCRCNMVQTEKQYIFLHDVIYEYLKRKRLLPEKTNKHHIGSKNVYTNPAFE